MHSAGFEPTTYRRSLQIGNNKNRALDHSANSSYAMKTFFQIKVNNLMTCIFCVKKEHKLYTFILFSQSTNDYFFIYKTFNLIIVKKILTVSVQRSLFYCMYFMLKSKGSQIFL